MKDLAPWALAGDTVFLNHGSFGACPTEVLAHQTTLRAEMEARPVRFLSRELEGRLAAARGALGRFLGAEADDLAFLTNATGGVNAVLRSLDFTAGDELVVTNHAYRACRNTLEYVAARAGARVITAVLPVPVREPQQVVDAIVAAVTPRTRLALIDHVTSPTGMVLPVAQVAAALTPHGVDVLVDGAHAPGMVPLDVASLGVAYYAGNCHKWLCAPKGSAFLWVRRDRQHAVHPLTISHGATVVRPERSRFRLEFDWMGTDDPTAWLTVPAAIEHVGGLLPGGWPALMAHNRALALEARRLLCEAVGTEPLCPDDMIGALASVALPDGRLPGRWPWADPLQQRLSERGFEVPVIPWPAPPRRLLRVSAQLYNERRDYGALAEVLREELA